MQNEIHAYTDYAVFLKLFDIKQISYAPHCVSVPFLHSLKFSFSMLFHSHKPVHQSISSTLTVSYQSFNQILEQPTLTSLHTPFLTTTISPSPANSHIYLLIPNICFNLAQKKKKMKIGKSKSEILSTQMFRIALTHVMKHLCHANTLH